jgi:hypothetical protein
MTAIAGQLNSAPGVMAVRTAILLALGYRAVAGWMSAFLDISHMTLLHGVRRRPDES